MQDLKSAIQHGLYDPAYEHDACGVGMVLHMKGAKSHAIVENGLRVLENMTHREPKTQITKAETAQVSCCKFPPTNLFCYRESLFRKKGIMGQDWSFYQKAKLNSNRA